MSAAQPDPAPPESPNAIAGRAAVLSAHDARFPVRPSRVSENRLHRAPGTGTTFAELFCAQCGVKPERFATAVFQQTLYRRARPLAPILRLLFRGYFEPDLDFIEGTGRLQDPDHLAGEVSHFQRHILNRGFLRHALKLRVSVWRVTRLVEAVMGERPGAKGEPTAGSEGDPAAPTAAKLSLALSRSDPGRDQPARGAGGPPVEILCVDDSLTCRHFYTAVFQRAGYPCECVRDGQEAYELLAANPRRFGVVITDHDMPRMGGLKLVKLLRESAFPVKVIVVSGSVNLGDCEAYKPLGVGKIICKPLMPDILLDAVARLTGPRPSD